MKILCIFIFIFIFMGCTTTRKKMINPNENPNYIFDEIDAYIVEVEKLHEEISFTLETFKKIAELVDSAERTEKRFAYIDSYIKYLDEMRHILSEELHKKFLFEVDPGKGANP